jgi:peptidoglycan/LPS O-acetylase OafA/YrhL
VLTAGAVVSGGLLLTLVFARLGQGRLASTDGEGVKFRGINALRALAALGVLASHVMATSPLTGLPHLLVENMASGVALFFVISGFLLFRPFAVSLGDRSRVSIRRFALNRALRILPLYLLAVAVVFIATFPHSSQPFLRLARALTFTGVYANDDLVPVAWSLDDEAAYYVLLPVLYLVLMAWPRPHQRLALGVGLISVLSVVSMVVLAANPPRDGFAAGPVPMFHLYGFGMLLAALHARMPAYNLSPRVLAAGVACLAGALAASGLAYDHHVWAFDPLCGLAFFSLVGVVSFAAPAGRLTTAISWRPLVHLGDVSYGVYLWHEPLHHVLANVGVLSGAYWLALLELAVVTVALASGTYYLVEKPALRLKGRWVASAPASVVSKPAVGALVLVRPGQETRSPARARALVRADDQTLRDLQAHQEHGDRQRGGQQT